MVSDNGVLEDSGFWVLILDVGYRLFQSFSWGLNSVCNLFDFRFRVLIVNEVEYVFVLF